MYDLLKGFEVAGKNFNRPVETYLVAAVVYFVICFSLSHARAPAAEEDRHHPLTDVYPHAHIRSLPPEGALSLPEAARRSLTP